MKDMRNFANVMNNVNTYSAISKRAETVIGFGGIRSAYSVIHVYKDVDKDVYFVNIFVKNEWGDKYTPLGDYQYYIKGGTISVSETDWNHNEEVLHENFYFPLHFSEEGKELFTSIVRYLVNK